MSDVFLKSSDMAGRAQKERSAALHSPVFWVQIPRARFSQHRNLFRKMNPAPELSNEKSNSFFVKLFYLTSQHPISALQTAQPPTRFTKTKRLHHGSRGSSKVRLFGKTHRRLGCPEGAPGMPWIKISLQSF